MDSLTEAKTRPKQVKMAISLAAVTYSLVLFQFAIASDLSDYGSFIELGGGAALCWFLLNRLYYRKNWARWFFGLLAFKALFSVSGMLREPYEYLIETIFWSVLVILQVSVGILLFTPESNKWFSGKCELP